MNTKELLGKFIDATIRKQPEEQKAAFNQYLEAKAASLVAESAAGEKSIPQAELNRWHSEVCKDVGADATEAEFKKVAFDLLDNDPKIDELVGDGDAEAYRERAVNAIWALHKTECTK